MKEDLLRGIYAYNFEKPSAIQQRAIIPIIRGRDVIAQAQSGTGKTATFSISMLQSIDTNLRETQALVLSPTRELAVQIQTVVLALGDYMNVSCHACIGGTSVGEDIRKLEAGQQVVSGTPGRVFDMIRRRNLRTKDIKVLLLFATNMVKLTHRRCSFLMNLMNSSTRVLRTRFTTSTDTSLPPPRSLLSPPLSLMTSSK